MGKVTANIGSSDEGRSVCVQSDGKILVAGSSNFGGNGLDFAIIRLGADGALDTSFGNGGKVLVDVGGYDDYAFAVALQSDGKILASGVSNDASGFADFGITRLNADGTLDTAFGTSGKATFSINGDDNAYSLRVQADGKILLAGTSASTGSSGTDFSVIRLSTSGALDTSFGTGGKATFANGTGNQGRGIDVQADGKILLAGWSVDTGLNKFSVLRLSADGALDTSFSADGKALISVGSYSALATSIKVQADGKILVAGDAVDASGNTDFAVVRLNSDGALDTTFGISGKSVHDIAGYSDSARALEIQSDGKILAAGYSVTASTGVIDFSILRLSAAGALDESFGYGGTATINIGDNDTAYSLALQADGKILLAGTSSDDFAVVRLNADGSLDSSFLDSAIDITETVTHLATSISSTTFGLAVGAGGTPLDQTHVAVGIHSTTFGLAVSSTIMLPTTTTHRATGIRSTTFGLAVGTGSATGQATSINSTTFGAATGTSIATLEQGLQSVTFGLASIETVNPTHVAQGINSTTFGLAASASAAITSSVQGVRFGLPVGTSIALMADGIASTTFGAATATCGHQVLPTMAGTAFGRAKLERGIAC